MRTAAAPVLGWAALLTLLAGVLLLWAPHAELQWGPLATAAAVTWAIGFGLVVRSRAAPPVPPERSYGTLTAAVGLFAIVGGALLGLWFSLVGAGLVLVGLAKIARESRR